MRNLRVALIACVAVAAAVACVPDVNLDGKSCDSAHPCVEGYVCHTGICLTPAEADAFDAGPADAGPVDAGPVDAGITFADAGATLSGDLAFPVGGTWNQSTVDGGAGISVSVYVDQSPVPCDGSNQVPGWAMELDAVVDSAAQQFPPGAYVLGDNGNGLDVEVSLVFQPFDGGVPVAYGSDVTLEDGGPQITGTATFTAFDDFDVKGSFDFQVVTDDGSVQTLSGSYTVNDFTCQ